MRNLLTLTTVKRYYDTIITTFDQIYEESHELEALGWDSRILTIRILTKQSTLFAIYLLDFVLPQVTKLSKCLLSEKLDLTIISSVVDVLRPGF